MPATTRRPSPPGRYSCRSASAHSNAAAASTSSGPPGSGSRSQRPNATAIAATPSAAAKWMSPRTPTVSPLIPATWGRVALRRAPTPGLPRDGVRLFENIGADVKLEPTRVIESPNVTHLRYRVVK
jgi:hypothetical protein